LLPGRGQGLQRICRFQESGEAFDQALDGLDIELVAPAEGVNDIGFGIALLGVAYVVGQLNVLDERAVFVSSGDRAYVHAHRVAVYAINCQE